MYLLKLLFIDKYIIHTTQSIHRRHDMTQRRAGTVEAWQHSCRDSAKPLPLGTEGAKTYIPVAARQFGVRYCIRMATWFRGLV